MYKIPANTLFIGKQLVFVPECHSTNSLALEMGSGAPEGTVVITPNQTAGRGQRGSRWEAESGMNLTFSVILKPTFLRVEDQFLLNMVVSLAVRDFLVEKTHQPVHIKWPNDVLVHGRKISGILIENQLQGGRFSVSVAGIGFNLNQEKFESPNATSLVAVTGRTEAPEQTLHQLLGHVENRYLQLRNRAAAELRTRYLDALYWRHERHRFRSSGGEFEGVIKGIDPVGRLDVECDGTRAYFDIKEIQFIA